MNRNDKPLVSVITPFYNREDYIEKCIDSIIGQTYANWELILIDDGSDDNTASICKSYMEKDKRIRLISNDGNRGVAYSRNKGLDAMKGEYIIFVDSDDFISKYYIELLLKIAQEQSCEMVQCKMEWECSSEKEDAFDINSHYHMTIHTDPADASRALQDGRDSRFGGMVCAKLYHSRLFDGVRFPLDKIHEDEAVTHILVYNANRRACISAKIYYYVGSSTSITRDVFSKKRYDIIDQLEARYQFYLDKGLTDCAYITAQRMGVQLIELYRNTKEHLGEDNQDLMRQYTDTLPRYIDSPFMTDEKKQLHQLWLKNPDEGEWYFSIWYMRENFSVKDEWV